MPFSDLPSGSEQKRRASRSSRPRKRAKFSLNDLPWKAVARPGTIGLDGDDGILELEEVEGVEVIYEDAEAGRTVKFNVVAGPSAIATENLRDVWNERTGRIEDDDQPVIGTPFDSTHSAITEPKHPVDDSSAAGNLIPEWHGLRLQANILQALHEKGFSKPTPIQAAALPVALKGRDVVGIAQTGSGKTLAYGLPILHHLLSQPRPSPSRRRPIRALVLAPTRELALQVSSHLNSIMTSIEHNDTTKSVDGQNGVAGKKIPHVSIAAVVGGMSSQKQKRLLDRGLDILVATPGRLWDILQDDDELAQEIRDLRFLVLDEADRMVQAGHFAELENILRLTLKYSPHNQISEEGFDDDTETNKDPKPAAQEELQTFVFSATLSKELQVNLKKKRKGNIKHHKRERSSSTLDDLLLQLDFRDPEPSVIDLSPKGGIVSTLQEGKIECLSTDKDVYLYYFLLRHPGKTLVFLSSIDGIRRLVPLLELLDINVFPLHSQLEQRQRLKNLDRFTNSPNSVLLATDIAARGLDIPAVDHVIHFQIPRSADAYIHRNGRTARAMQAGFSMLMIAPDERRVAKALLNSLNREVDKIPEISIELGILDEIKARVRLARKIDNAQHKAKKTNHDRKWMKETAEVLGVELDSDFASDSENENPSAAKQKKVNGQRTAMKAELREMISQPLIARGISTKYITSGSRPIIDDLLAGELNEKMLLKKRKAGNSLVNTKRKKRKTQVKAAET